MIRNPTMANSVTAATGRTGGPDRQPGWPTDRQMNSTDPLRYKATPSIKA